MAFFSIFFKTLGLLLGITSFVIIINLFTYLLDGSGKNFAFVEGDQNSNNVIATINLNGPIVNNLNRYFTGNIVKYIDPKDIEKILSEAKLLDIKVLIIKINSPGGTVTATSQLERIINKFKNENNIKVYFYSNEVLASGGYWAATTGDGIFANYGTIIGSIGVSGPSWYYYNNPKSISNGLFGQKIETENGIEIFDQNAGNSKDLYNPFRKPTKEELYHLQEMIEDIYNDFLSKVSSSRKIEISTLKNEIGALIFNSNQAKDKFLIDDVLDFNQLIKKIIKINNFKDYKVFEFHSEEKFFDKILSNYFNSSYVFICNKINTNFVSILPLYLNSC